MKLKNIRVIDTARNMEADIVTDNGQVCKVRGTEKEMKQLGIIVNERRRTAFSL